MYRLFFKRFLDLTVSFTALVLLSPVFVLIFLVQLLYYRGKPFFFQQRPGCKGRIFNVIKFRSMLDKYDENGELLPPVQRVTPWGIFLRKTSLDELPQLINVIKGDMSFIGPRPLLVRYLPYYTQIEAKRHEVRPGITGLAQVSGRNNLEWNKRLALDVQYVEQLSLKLDLLIFIKTIAKVIKGSDVKIVPDGKPFDIYRRDERSFKSTPFI